MWYQINWQAWIYLLIQPLENIQFYQCKEFTRASHNMKCPFCDSHCLQVVIKLTEAIREPRIISKQHNMVKLFHGCWYGLCGNNQWFILLPWMCGLVWSSFISSLRYLFVVANDPLSCMSREGSEKSISNISIAAVVLKEASSCCAAVPNAKYIGWCPAGLHAWWAVLWISFSLIFLYRCSNSKSWTAEQTPLNQLHYIPVPKYIMVAY